MGLSLNSLVASSQLSQPFVRVETEPSNILPFEAEAQSTQSPTKFVFKVFDGKGRPIENAKIQLMAIAPAKNIWFTTDFPVVEGTKLLQLQGNVVGGEFRLEKMLPIRGKYQIIAKVIPNNSNDFSPFEEKLTLSVGEFSGKYINFAILLAILLAVGFTGGLVIAGKQNLQEGEKVPKKVRLLLSSTILIAIATLLYVNISAEIVDSHHSHSSSSIQGSLPEVNSQDLKVEILGDNYATVGTPSSLGIQVINSKTNLPITDVNLKIKTIQLEDGWSNFVYQTIPDSRGQFNWQEQFFDGAPHRVEVEVTPLDPTKFEFKSFTVTKTIEVEGIAPPLIVRLIVLAYLITIVIIGFLLGFYGKNLGKFSTPFRI
jgi:hypothetical protein